MCNSFTGMHLNISDHSAMQHIGSSHTGSMAGLEEATESPFHHVFCKQFVIGIQNRMEIMLDSKKQKLL